MTEDSEETFGEGIKTSMESVEINLKGVRCLLGWRIKIWVDGLQVDFALEDLNKKVGCHLFEYSFGTNIHIECDCNFIF